MKRKFYQSPQILILTVDAEDMIRTSEGAVYAEDDGGWSIIV